jgi:glycosyltransferase involved in cell wall biosynthesis
MRVAAKLDPDSFDVWVVCPRSRDRNVERDIRKLEQAGVKVREIAMKHAIRPVYDSAAFAQLWKLLRTERFDIVHSHSSKAGLLARPAARMTGAATVYTAHAFAFQRRAAKPVRLALLLVERLLSRITDRLVAVSEGECEVVVRNKVAAAEKVEIIVNGLDFSEFRGQVDRKAKAKELGIDNHYRVVGMVARIVAQKGFQYFLRAAEIVLNRFPDTIFVLVGDGERRNEAEALVKSLNISGRVVMTGNREDIPAIYSVFDVFVLPSLWEGLPYAVLEAMAMGKPVIATRIPGIEELIDDGQTGCLVPPGDAASLSEAILMLLGDTERANQMGRAAQRAVREKYRLETQIRKLENLYRDIAWRTSH